MLSQLDDGTEPSLALPLSDLEASAETSPPIAQIHNPLVRTTTVSSDGSSATRRLALSIRSLYGHQSRGAASLASAAAFCSDYLASRPYRTYSVRTFCESLLNSPRASQASIASVKRYGDRSGVPHRFLILHIVRDDGKDFYLRLDRRPDRGDIPLWKFAIRDFGSSKAVDTASINSTTFVQQLIRAA